MLFRITPQFELFASRLIWDQVSRAPGGQTLGAAPETRVETVTPAPGAKSTDGTPSTEARLEGVRRQVVVKAGAQEQAQTGREAERRLDAATKTPSAGPRPPEAAPPTPGQTPSEGQTATGTPPEGQTSTPPQPGTPSESIAEKATTGGMLAGILASLGKLLEKVIPQIEALIDKITKGWNDFWEKHFPKPQSLIRGPSGESVAAYVKEGFTPGYGIGIEVPSNTNLYLSMGTGKVKEKGSNHIVIEQEGGKMIRYTNVDPSDSLTQGAPVTVKTPVAKSHGGLVRYQVFEAGEGGVPKEIDPTPQLSEANLITTTPPEQPQQQPAPGPQTAPTQAPPAAAPGAQQTPGNQSAPTAGAALETAAKPGEGEKKEGEGKKDEPKKEGEKPKEEKADASKKSWWDRLWS